MNKHATCFHLSASWLLFHLLFQIHLDAQSSSDILRYLEPRMQGTARVLGAGSAFSAVGADQGSIGTNAAGLAFFRRSDFSFGLYHNNLAGDYQLEGASNGSSGVYNAGRTHLANLGFVVVNGTNPGSSWVTSNFFVGYNNTATFQQNINYSGASKGSILHRFLENARDPAYSDGRGLSEDRLDEFETRLAYETGALYDISKDSTRIFYTNDLAGHLNALVPKNGSYDQSGRQGNLSIAYAANYDEKLMVGASLDILMANYRLQKNYSEHAEGQNLDPFRQLDFSDYVSSELNGIKGSLGIIYKPVRSFRAGLSWHTPSVLSLHDQFNTSLDYSYYDKGSTKQFSASSPDGVFDYRIIIPSRWIASAAVVKRYGLLSIDLDYISPDKARFTFTDGTDLDYQKQLNEEIRQQFKSVVQTRIGLEIPYKHLRLRGGAGFLPSPYTNEDKINSLWSAGIGYRGENFYCDLGYQQFRYSEGLVPFRTGNSDLNNDGRPDAVETVVRSSLNQQHFLLTLGFRY